ncbi:pyridoxal phosphate-dependent transferase [Halteromyces radiatus]|uniref:pyridoxal phosphate-dependent transferase n=1 Tax=Halteromyces radiatus TaxID=101107 RepID=UPI00221F9CA7|nr:pyridoxal phosphate-dependent transferase [Halteromyces radiatus]KAI8093458.1 pyridoxal phosphate-dependent transferase [Halteromyces radiatus]
MDFTLPDNGAGIEDTFELIKDTLKFSVNTWNPRFMDKLYAGTNPIGVISEIILAVLNSNSHVYHCSPVLSLMEVEVTRATARLLNMGKDAGGLLCPGGSASNLLAMVTARNRLYPSIKTKGYLPRPYVPNAEYGVLKVFTSTDSHYSIEKAAQVLGLGMESVIKVPTDEYGRMRMDELERLLQESLNRNETPFFINATSGTTVMGAFDPLDKIAILAKKYNCWCHADGSFGGSAVFSDQVIKTKDWFHGSELVDSFTMNPHKLLGVPLQCSMLLTPHNGHLLFAQANSLKADYLFHGNSYDLGAGTIGCGRRPDALKVFLAWKFYGKNGLGKRVDRALSSASEFMDMVRQRPGFVLVKDPCPFVQVCFWYIPSSIKNKLDEWKLNGLYQEKVAVVTKLIQQRINHSGSFLVDHAPLNDLPDFFRIVINAPTVSVQRDLSVLLDRIELEANSIEWNNIV